MAENPTNRRCAHPGCGQPLPPATGRGRPPLRCDEHRHLRRHRRRPTPPSVIPEPDAGAVLDALRRLTRRQRRAVAVVFAADRDRSASRGQHTVAALFASVAALAADVNTHEDALIRAAAEDFNAVPPGVSPSAS